MDTATTEPTTDTLQRQAIEALTALARQSRARGAGTPDATTEPVDFADLAAHVLTAVAANMGSVGTLLAGRPGSWEADLIRRLVEGTAGEDVDELIRYRTEPVQLHFDAEDTFYDFGIGDLYDPEQKAAFDRAGDDTLTEQEQDATDELANQIERLWEQDKTAYTEAFRATAERYLTEIGATCGVQIADGPPRTAWDGAEEKLHEYARQHTPLPMTGSAPDWSDGTPADALRRAGRTYTARAQQTRS